LTPPTLLSSPRSFRRFQPSKYVKSRLDDSNRPHISATPQDKTDSNNTVSFETQGIIEQFDTQQPSESFSLDGSDAN